MLLCLIVGDSSSIMSIIIGIRGGGGRGYYSGSSTRSRERSGYTISGRSSGIILIVDIIVISSIYSHRKQLKGSSSSFNDLLQITYIIRN